MRQPTSDTPVVVGLGLVTALAFGRDATLEGVRAGQSGVRTVGDAAIAVCEEPYLRVEVSRELEAQIKFLNGAGELAVTAAQEAWHDAGWDAADIDAERKGLWLSQMDAWDWNCIEMRGGFALATEDFEKPVQTGKELNKAIARFTKPFFLLESLKNNAFSFLANLFQLKGANTSVAGFAGGTSRILDLAARSVRRGTLDRSLVVAAGRIANAMGVVDVALQGLRGSDDEAAFRPLDAHGAGLVVGEGAAALAVERYADAKAREARIRALLLANVAITGDPLSGIASPEASTITRVAAMALEEAGVQSSELAAVVVPAVGVNEADQALLDGLGAVPATRGVPVTSYRGATGHMALASDLADLALAIEVLDRGDVPATVGTTTPLSPVVTTTCTPTEGDAVLVISAGLQGEASGIVIGRPR